MPSRPPLPPLLSRYTDQPSGSLTLLTSTLGATASWIVLRFVFAALQTPGYTSSNDGSTADGRSGETRVVLVSWLRDINFWKDGGRKLNINYQKVHIIDALTRGMGSGLSVLAKVEETIMQAIHDAAKGTQREERVLLVLDGLDLMLASTSCPISKALEMIGDFREVYHRFELCSPQ